MTANTFGQAETLVERDRWGRPLIKPEDGTGKPTAYTRCTTYVKALDDMNNLMSWKARMTLLGAVKSPAIVKAAKLLTPDDKSQANKLVEDALTLAGAGDKATEGTTLHKLTELDDGGHALPEGLDDGTLADLAAYRQAIGGLGVVSAETFVVCDDIKVAGTFDRLFTIPSTDAWPEWLRGKRVIGDLKTGSLEWSIGAIAAQLAVYAHGRLYDPATGARTDHGADTTVGLVVHLPQGEARCDLYAVNLTAGWEAAQLSGQVRTWRSGAKLSKLAVQVGPTP